MSFLSYQSSNCQNLRTNCDTRTIVFIDSRISNSDTLIQQVKPEVRAIFIGSLADGMRDITGILNSSCCREVHLVGTGAPGCIYLGNSELSLNTLIQYQSELQSWFDFNSPYCNLISPRISLSGCNIAAGDVGAELLAKLHAMTGAEIVASANVSRQNIFN